MPIPLITNFTINQAAPVDDRMVVTSSSLRDAIQYKYDGLTVFQTDTRSSWTWNATSATWSYNVAGNGIYSGSGSVVGDTYINLNSISTGAAANTTSNLLGYYSNLTGVSSIYYLNTVAVKKSTSPSSQLSFKIQNSLNSTNYSYIEFNPDSTDVGSIAIGNNNTEYLRISNSGNLNLWRGNLILWSPTYSITFNTSYLSANNIYYLPNKTGILAMTSDISTLAATVSAISLQTVTSVGATTSRPVSMLSSLSVGSTFSISNYMNFSPTNLQTISYLTSNSYVIDGLVETTQNSLSSYSGGYGYITTLNLPCDCSVTIEVLFNSSQYTQLSSIYSSSPTYYNRVSKVVYTFTINWTGTITGIGYTLLYSHSGSSVLNDGTVEISGSSIKLRNYWTPVGGGYDTYVNLKCQYKLFVSYF